ncbi:MAG: rRNA adenine N-6-methyltransferase family protein [Pseudomonadota bacterium]
MALAPSSRALCDAMVFGLNPSDGAIIELGPGTGKVTESLLACGFSQSQLTLFELNPDFYELLKQRFPNADVRLQNATRCETAQHDHVQACVSGLPLLSFSAALQLEILSTAFSKMGAEGVFVQYTYGYRSPVRDGVLAELGLVAQVGRKIWGNLPPARVYRIVKAAI